MSSLSFIGLHLSPGHRGIGALNLVTPPSHHLCPGKSPHLSYSPAQIQPMRCPWYLMVQDLRPPCSAGSDTAALPEQGCACAVPGAGTPGPQSISHTLIRGCRTGSPAAHSTQVKRKGKLTTQTPYTNTVEFKKKKKKIIRRRT